MQLMIALPPPVPFLAQLWDVVKIFPKQIERSAEHEAAAAAALRSEMIFGSPGAEYGKEQHMAMLRQNGQLLGGTAGQPDGVPPDLTYVWVSHVKPT